MVWYHDMGFPYSRRISSGWLKDMRAKKSKNSCYYNAMILGVFQVMLCMECIHMLHRHLYLKKYVMYSWANLISFATSKLLSWAFTKLIKHISHAMHYLRTNRWKTAETYHILLEYIPGVTCVHKAHLHGISGQTLPSL